MVTAVRTVQEREEDPAQPSKTQRREPALPADAQELAALLIAANSPSAVYDAVAALSRLDTSALLVILARLREQYGRRLSVRKLEQSIKDYRATPKGDYPHDALYTWMTDLPADDSGNAECLERANRGMLVYSPHLGWLHRTRTHMKPVHESVAIRWAEGILRRRHRLCHKAGWGDLLQTVKPSRSNISSALYLFQARVTMSSIDKLDAEPHLVNCKNGVVNFKTGELQPHSPTRFTYCVPMPYEPGTDESVFYSHIMGAVNGNAELAAFVQRALGYSITGETREECFFYLYGPTRSGKGTLTETLRALLPKPFSITRDFESFSTSRSGDTQNFDLAGLKSSRLVIASESNRNQRLNSAKIKDITGGGEISAAHKHKEHFEFPAKFKVWLVSNHPVNGDAGDDAFWARTHVIHFPVSHLGHEDRELKERLRSPEALKGAFAWIVQGAIAYYREGLKAPEAVKELTRQQRYEQDYLAQFIEESFDIVREVSAGSPLPWMGAQDINTRYTAWCEESNVYAMSPKELGIALRDRFHLEPKRYNKARGFLGIKPRGERGMELYDDDAPRAAPETPENAVALRLTLPEPSRNGATPEAPESDTRVAAPALQAVPYDDYCDLLGSVPNPFGRLAEAALRYHLQGRPPVSLEPPGRKRLTASGAPLFIQLDELARSGDTAQSAYAFDFLAWLCHKGKKPGRVTP